MKFYSVIYLILLKMLTQYFDSKRFLFFQQQQSHPDVPSVPKSGPLSASPTPSKQIKMDSPPSTPIPFPPPTPTPTPLPVPHRVPPFPDLPIPITMMDYVWNGMDGLKPPFLSPYLPWFGSAKRSVLGFSNLPPIGTSQDAVFQVKIFLQHLRPFLSLFLYSFKLIFICF